MPRVCGAAAWLLCVTLHLLAKGQAPVVWNFLHSSTL